MKYLYGTINRPIKIKKRVERSPHIINLTPEAKLKDLRLK